MYIKTEYAVTEHVRPSKLGKTHTYYRKKSVVVLKCDNCGNVFTRDKGSMDPKRLTNNFYHVCSNCDGKKFAQEKGVESKRVWDLPVSSLKTIGRL